MPKIFNVARRVVGWSSGNPEGGEDVMCVAASDAKDDDDDIPDDVVRFLDGGIGRVFRRNSRHTLTNIGCRRGR